MSSSNETSCNLTAYSEWYHDELNNTDHVPLSLPRLRTDLLQVERSQKRNWRVMNFEEDRSQFLSLYGGRRPQSLNITRGQAMDVASNWCEDAIRSVKVANAGGHGPPPDLPRDNYHGNFLLAVHDAMCDDYCIASDHWRAEAMAASRCDCLQLSTQDDDISYVGPGDFCATNSGEVLCREIGLGVCAAVANFLTSRAPVESGIEGKFRSEVVAMSAMKARYLATRLRLLLRLW